MVGLLERIDERLERIEARLAKCVTEPGEGDPVDQTKSALGPRRHCAAVRRLRAAGDSRAFKVGRKYLMTPELYAEELARASLAPPAANDDSPEASLYQRALQKALAR
jgi:hypothetical protein